MDDEELICETYCDMLLPNFGHEVSRGRSVEALEAFKAGPDEFDLVITDQAMPYRAGSTWQIT